MPKPSSSPSSDSSHHSSELQIVEGENNIPDVDSEIEDGNEENQAYQAFMEECERLGIEYNQEIMEWLKDEKNIDVGSFEIKQKNAVLLTLLYEETSKKYYLEPRTHFYTLDVFDTMMAHGSEALLDAEKIHSYTIRFSSAIEKNSSGNRPLTLDHLRNLFKALPPLPVPEKRSPAEKTQSSSSLSSTLSSTQASKRFKPSAPNHDVEDEIQEIDATKSIATGQSRFSPSHSEIPDDFYSSFDFDLCNDPLIHSDLDEYIKFKASYSSDRIMSHFYTLEIEPTVVKEFFRAMQQIHPINNELREKKRDILPNQWNDLILTSFLATCMYSPRHKAWCREQIDHKRITRIEVLSIVQIYAQLIVAQVNQGCLIDTSDFLAYLKSARVKNYGVPEKVWHHMLSSDHRSVSSLPSSSHQTSSLPPYSHPPYPNQPPHTVAQSFLTRPPVFSVSLAQQGARAANVQKDQPPMNRPLEKPHQSDTNYTHVSSLPSSSSHQRSSLLPHSLPSNPHPPSYGRTQSSFPSGPQYARASNVQTESRPPTSNPRAQAQQQQNPPTQSSQPQAQTDLVDPYVALLAKSRSTKNSRS